MVNNMLSHVMSRICTANRKTGYEKYFTSAAVGSFIQGQLILYFLPRDFSTFDYMSVENADQTKRVM